MIGTCKCAHKGQDELHGPGKRVINEEVKKDKILRSCTVCGSKTEIFRTSSDKK